MKRFLSLLCGVAIVAAASTTHAQVNWALGAPGGTDGGSLDFTPATPSVFLDTGIPAAQVGGDRGDAGAVPPVPSTASDYTITAWIFTRNDNGFGEAGDDNWWLGTGNQGIHFGIFDTSKIRSGHWGSDLSGTSIIPSNTWVHVAYAFDADGGTVDAVTGVQNGSVQIYMNGVAENDGVAQDQLAPNNSTTNLILGARNNGNTGNDWDGLIDDVAVFTSVLSPADIDAMARDSSQAIALGAAAYYDFEDDQTGTTAANAGALGSDITGITGELPPLPLTTNWADGAPLGSGGGAASFANEAGGEQSLFIQTDIPALTLGIRDEPVDYTVSAWINSAEDNGFGEAVNDRWWFGTGDQGVHLGILNGALRSGHWGADVGGTTIVPANTWVHATYVYDADGGAVNPDTGVATGLSTIYFDGVMESNSPQDQAGPNRANTNLIFGSRSAGREGWNGIVDDIAIFPTALSSTDVATLAGDSTQALALGAVTYYDFNDDQTGSTAANAGTLGSAITQMIPAMPMDFIKGDVNMSGAVSFADIPPFIAALQTGTFSREADTNCDMSVSFADIPPFIRILQNP